MLSEARTLRDNGVDVVLGYIEPHDRPETMALAQGFESIANLEIPYKNIVLKEFDLDATLKRKPALVLVDELAHTNAKGLRNERRFQDIEELLKAGIDVYTTLNIQHLESLNDLVANISKIEVKERIPDRIFDEADQVELVDIESNKLLKRMQDGKIYKEKQAKLALENFFRQERLIALREIALRRLALAFHAKLSALYIKNPNIKEEKALEENIELAKSFDAEIISVYDDDIARQIAEYSSLSNVSKIVLGKNKDKKSLKKRFLKLLLKKHPILIYILLMKIKFLLLKYEVKKVLIF